MKSRHWLANGLVLVAVMWASSAPAGVCPVDVCVRFDPPDTTVNLNDVFTIDIVADINTAIVGWGFDLAIDTPAVASLSAEPAIPAPCFAENRDPCGGLSIGKTDCA